MTNILVSFAYTFLGIIVFGLGYALGDFAARLRPQRGLIYLLPAVTSFLFLTLGFAAFVLGCIATGVSIYEVL